MNIRKTTMVHLNGHLLCAMDTETTGLRAGFHEVIQLAILPLDARLERIETIPTLDLLIRPNYPERADSDAIRKIGRAKFQKAIIEGLPCDAAVDIFEGWFARLGLPEGRRITPLAHNWKFDHQMLQQLMGFEHLNHYIDGRARDTLVSACLLNDRADFNGEQIPFPGSLSLASVARSMSVEVIDTHLHDAVYDCWTTARIYKKMLLEVLA